jgi:glycosyltransferase involved in cell wall biosynthesis
LLPHKQVREFDNLVFQGAAMDATIVICTRNRAESLTRALQSLVAMEAPAGFSWNVVVVDNGSTDQTPRVVADFSDRLAITRVPEERPGLSNARNRGIAAVNANYIIWTDDDVVVEPGWLAAYAAAFRRWPEAAVFGGKILPVLEEPAAAWFAKSIDELDYLLAARDFGASPLPLSHDRQPFGANYVVRTDEQRRWPYDPNLGAGAGGNRVGEETAVISAVLAAGATGFYVPDSVVRHMIPHGRQTISYVTAYYRAHGETAALTAHARGTRLPGGVPPWLLRRIVRTGAEFAVARLVAPPPVYIRKLKRLAFALGYAGFLRNQTGTAGRKTPP